MKKVAPDENRREINEGYDATLFIYDIISLITLLHGTRKKLSFYLVKVNSKARTHNVSYILLYEHAEINHTQMTMGLVYQYFLDFTTSSTTHIGVEYCFSRSFIS